MNQDSYNSNSLGFDQPQPPQSPVIHQPPQELSIQEMEDLKQQYLDELKCLSIPSLSIEEPNNSQSMGDEHLDTILAMESDEFIKSSVENLIPILSESTGISEHMCDVPSHDNSPPLDVLKDQFEDFSKSNDDFSSTDDDSFFIDKIDYVEVSSLDSELVGSEVMEIVIPEVGGIDDDILLTIKDDILQVDAFLNVEDEPTSSQFLKSYLDPEGDILLLEAFLNDDHSPDFKIKSSSTSLNSLLEETNTFDNSLPEFENFYFDVEEISSGSTTTHSDISLPEYEAFYDDHRKEISSGSPTTHSDSPLYALFIFDLSINPFPPADRSDFYEFPDELIPFISPPEYDCFLFKPRFLINYESEPGYIENYNPYPYDSSSFPQQELCCEDYGVLPEADHCQPPQYTVNHLIFNAYNDLLNANNDLLNSQNKITIAQNKLMEQMTSMCAMIPACCDDEDDYNSAITPNEPVDSLSVGDEHLNTILATESDEFIKSCVENLFPNPSESEGESECDMLAREEFTTFSNILFNADYEFDSSDDQSCSDEDIVVRQLISSSTGRIFYENSNADIESFSPSHIPVEDSDSFMKEIDLSFNLDDPMPPSIEEDDDDSERDILILEELPDIYSLSLPVNGSFYFDIPSFSRPPAKPPDGERKPRK
nr:hypothetical protein [Tanacetum cinerariifolium]